MAMRQVINDDDDDELLDALIQMRRKKRIESCKCWRVEM